MHDGVVTVPKIGLDRGARAAFLHRAEELTPLVAVDAEGARFLLDTSDENITPSLFLKRSRGEIRSLRRAAAVLGSLGLRSVGGTLIDVGANVGTTTISALREHGFERAVACEPEGRNVRLLGSQPRRERAARTGEGVPCCRRRLGPGRGASRRAPVLRPARGSPARAAPAAGPEASHRVGSVQQTTLDALARGAYEPPRSRFSGSTCRDMKATCCAAPAG